MVLWLSDGTLLFLAGLRSLRRAGFGKSTGPHAPRTAFVRLFVMGRGLRIVGYDLTLLMFRVKAVKTAGNWSHRSPQKPDTHTHGELFTHSALSTAAALERQIPKPDT